LANPEPLKALGRFRHEAVAVDPRSGVVYQTEDLNDGCIYRFIPHQAGRLAAGGKLQALAIHDRKSLDTRNWPDGSPGDHHVDVGRSLPVAWVDLDQIDAPDDDLRLRAQAAGAARFARGEGMWYGRDAVYFCCTNGGRIKAGQVWRYVPSPHEGQPGEAGDPGRLELFVEPNDTNLLENGDNITVAPWGDLVICEDGEGIQHLVGVTPAGELYKIGRTRLAHDEFAGATFSPDGRTLFVNLQGAGLTLAITGPWPAPRPARG
jgi:secreted PhoX family phosphatase